MLLMSLTLSTMPGEDLDKLIRLIAKALTTPEQEMDDDDDDWEKNKPPNDICGVEYSLSRYQWNG